MKNGHTISRVLPGSIGEEAGLKPGDQVVSVNGTQVQDVFDYQYLTEDEYLEVLIRQSDGEEWVLEVEKDEDEDLGLEFENGLMDEYRSCRNKCIFCFIDQMPPGMRDTLYFKDDDSRLSFLQGNYVTLTNMGREDIERIIRYHLSPINISVHTTNPELRCRMLHNRFAGEALKKIDLLYQAGMKMNGQIVLCKGYNDGPELERTIEDLGRYCPVMESVSVVPVGLTRYREGLTPLEPFTKEEAGQVVDTVERWQKEFFARHGLHFIHASDEFYLLAEREMPKASCYDGYPQLENGVGMLRLLMEEVSEALNILNDDGSEEKGKNERNDQAGCQECEAGMRKVSVVTGKLAGPLMRRIAGMVTERYPRVEISVCEIANDFFGEMITVSGLLTGQDLIRQLQGKELGDCLLIPANMVKSDEDIFLDDVTKEDAENALQVPLVIVKSSGHELVRHLLGLALPEDETGERHQPYESPAQNSRDGKGASYCKQESNIWENQ